MRETDKENIDRRELLEIYNLIAGLFPVYPSPFKLGQAFMCSELSDFGFTEDEFISFI